MDNNDNISEKISDKSDAETVELSPEELKEKVYEALGTIYDPEIPVDIRSLGLIYDVQVTSLNEVVVLMTLTAPNCPEAGSLPVEAEWKIKHMPGVKDVKVMITFDPPWDKSMMSDAARLTLGMF